jgi:hypothetical protein
MHVYKFGRNPDIDTGAGLPEDIVDNSLAYTWPSSAGVAYLSSSNNADVQTIRVFGLDADYMQQNEEVVLTGNTVAATSLSYLRLHRAYVVGSAAPAGDVYVQTGTAETSGVPDDLTLVLAKITQGYNQTLQAVYTVPKNFQMMHVRRWTGAIRSAAAAAGATLALQVRAEGGVFRTKATCELHTYAGMMSMDFGNGPDAGHHHLHLNGGTDVRVRCTDVSNNNSIISSAFVGDLQVGKNA